MKSLQLRPNVTDSLWVHPPPLLYKQMLEFVPLYWRVHVKWRLIPWPTCLYLIEQKRSVKHNLSYAVTRTLCRYCVIVLLLQIIYHNHRGPFHSTMPSNPWVVQSPDWLLKNFIVACAKLMPTPPIYHLLHPTVDIDRGRKRIKKRKVRQTKTVN